MKVMKHLIKIGASKYIFVDYLFAFEDCLVILKKIYLFCVGELTFFIADIIFINPLKTIQVTMSIGHLVHKNI